MIADRSLGIFQKIRLSNFDFIFKEQTDHCMIPSEWGQIYSNDASLYEVVPHLTAQGLGLIYEENGQTYIFQGGGMEKPDRSQMDNTFDVRNVFWFTPCNVEEINGIALGLLPENVKNLHYGERAYLTINGLNLHLNPFAIMSIFNPQFQGPFPDSISYYEEHLQKEIETQINGLNVSLVNNVNETKLSGVNIAGAITVNDEIDGVTVSGISNFAYKLKGVSIAPVNLTTEGRGVQLGLFNKATDFRGIQIGLWNKNAKRSLPFINWQFGPKK
jgi:hypothetical protein